MRLPRFIETFVGKWKEEPSNLYDDKNAFMHALERKKAKKLAERVRTGEPLSPDEQEFLQWEEIWKTTGELSSVVEFSRDDTAYVVERILSQMWAEKIPNWIPPLESSTLEKIQIDESSRIVIPKYLRTADIYAKKLAGKESLALSDITEEMIRNLVLIDIEIQLSSWTRIVTQLHRRMNINGIERSIFEYIFHVSQTEAQKVS